MSSQMLRGVRFWNARRITAALRRALGLGTLPRSRRSDTGSSTAVTRSEHPGWRRWRRGSKTGRMASSWARKRAAPANRLLRAAAFHPHWPGKSLASQCVAAAPVAAAAGGAGAAKATADGPHGLPRAPGRAHYASRRDRRGRSQGPAPARERERRNAMVDMATPRMDRVAQKALPAERIVSSVGAA